jgi:hypothetical protein
LHQGALPPLPARDLAVGVLGSGGFVLYIVWMVLLLRCIRPAVARRLGRALGVRIDERYRGQWSAEPPAPRHLGCIVGIADISILLCGALGPLLVLSFALLLLGGS